MVKRLKVVFERLAADGDPFFDDKRCLNGAERVALNGVRRVGKFVKSRLCLPYLYDSFGFDIDKSGGWVRMRRSFGITALLLAAS